MGGGFEGTVISRRGAEALSFLAMALALRLLGGMTSVSSGTARQSLTGLSALGDVLVWSTLN